MNYSSMSEDHVQGVEQSKSPVPLTQEVKSVPQTPQSWRKHMSAPVPSKASCSSLFDVLSSDDDYSRIEENLVELLEGKKQGKNGEVEKLRLVISDLCFSV